MGANMLSNLYMIIVMTLGGASFLTGAAVLVAFWKPFQLAPGPLAAVRQLRKGGQTEAAVDYLLLCMVFASSLVGLAYVAYPVWINNGVFIARELITATAPLAFHSIVALVVSAHWRVGAERAERRGLLVAAEINEDAMHAHGFRPPLKVVAGEHSR